MDCKINKLDYRNILLVDINKLKKDSFLDLNISDDAIRVAIMATQDMIVEYITGSCLMKTLKQMICSNTINAESNEVYYDLVREYLFPIFVYNVPLELNIPLTFKTRNAGNIQVNDETLNTTELNDIRYINSQYRIKVDFYIKRALDYLKCHRNELCLCCNSNCGCNVAPFNKVFKVGILLDTPTTIYSRARAYKKGGY